MNYLIFKFITYPLQSEKVGLIELGLDSYLLVISPTAEISILENNIIVYKFVQDLHFYVTGGEDENELILSSVLQGFFDAVGILLRYLS